MRSFVLVALVACGHSGSSAQTGDDDTDARCCGSDTAEIQPAPADGDGIADPQSTTLHDHSCGGVDWQHIHNFVLLRHAAPELDDPTIQSCVTNYAGWVTHAADNANVSRASVYAALAAANQCDAYTGTMLTGDQCAAVYPDLDATACAAKMAASQNFGITAVAQLIAKSTIQDPVLIGAYIGHGSVECGGSDRWKLAAPANFVDHYVAAYNSAAALVTPMPACGKRIVVSVALYTGMDDPGVDGIAGNNGCWTYERISKTNKEWNVCQYDGYTSQPGAGKWVYDDTNPFNNVATETSRINACKTGRGYVYMANRSGSWPAVVTAGVTLHFAELYSSQDAIDDQLAQWQSAGTPGAPMVNFGEAATSTTTITNVTKTVCGLLANGGDLGVYVYPEPLAGARMTAMVQGLNACTKP